MIGDDCMSRRSGAYEYSDAASSDRFRRRRWLVQYASPSSRGYIFLLYDYVFLCLGATFLGLIFYHSLSKETMTDSETCGFEGNPDIYGIGIRIGFYTQALAAWFANYFLASEARSLRSVNLIFLFALFICLLVYSFKPTDRQAIEVFCMLQFGMVMAFVSVGDSQTRYSTRYLPSNPRQIIVYHLLGVGGLCFSTWFWWAGLDYFQPTNCGTYLWVVVKVDLYGWVRIWMKVGHILGLCCLSGMLWTAFSRVLQHERFRSTRNNFVEYVHIQEPGLTNRIWEARSKAPHSTATEMPTQSNHVDHECGKADVSFESILEAEKYLDNLVGVYANTDKSPRPRPQDERYDGGPLRTFYSLISDNVFVIKTVSTWIWNTKEARRMFDLNSAIAKHTSGLRVNVALYRPRIFRRMVEEPYPSTSWKTLCLASDVQQSQLPLYSNNTWYILGTRNIFLIVMIILQIELTVYWNNITGLLDPTSFGQLLALVLGVGGLCKVIWQKFWNVSHGKKESDFQPESTSYEAGFRVYLTWKRRTEQLSELEKRTGSQDDTNISDSSITVVPSASSWNSNCHRNSC